MHPLRCPFVFARVIGLLALLVLIAGDVAAAQKSAATFASTRPELTGTVRRQDGRPVVHAAVYIYTAAWRTGTSPFCPSCYVDCGKWQRTGSTGAFRIRSLDPKLIFRLLVVCEGYESTFVSGVDPERGPVSIVVRRARVLSGGPGRILNGRVLDTDGHPVVGATVEPTGCRWAQGEQYGGIAGLTPLTITGADGRFHLECPFDSALIRMLIKARGLAPQATDWLKAGASVPHVVRLTQGVTLSGMVCRPNGQGLAGVTVQATPVDHSSGTFVRWSEIGTDAAGRFLLPNLAAGQEYQVCVKMEGLSNSDLAVPSQRIRTDKDGALLEGITLLAQPAATVVGRVALPNSRPLPAGLRVMLGRVGTWDVIQVPLMSDGRFTFRGVPTEEAMELTVQVQGYRLSAGVPESDPQGDQVHLCVPVTTRTLDLALPMEPVP